MKKSWSLFFHELYNLFYYATIVIGFGVIVMSLAILAYDVHNYTEWHQNHVCTTPVAVVPDK